MSIDADVYATIADQIDSVYPIAVPLGATLPAVTYQRISTLRRRTHEGTALIGPLYQFTCWSESPKGARQVARDVVAVWEPIAPHSGGLLDQAQIENQTETYDPARKLYGAIVDVRVWAHADED